MSGPSRTPARPDVRVDRRDGIVTLTIDRPEARNSLPLASQAALVRSWAALVRDPEVRVVIVTGAEHADSPPQRQSFCAGTDMKEYAGAPLDDLLAAADGGSGLPSLCEIENRVPVIAAVNGYCIGAGIGMLLASDLRVASEWASFGLPELDMGTIPGNGSIPRAVLDLPRIAAMELLLLPQRLSSARARDLGLVNAVVAHEEVMSTALGWAEHISALPSPAVRAALELAHRSRRLALEDAARVESMMLAALRAR